MSHALKINNVSHSFGTKKVLSNVNLEIPTGQFVSVVGPSGCGKSTLLRAILGTHPPLTGEIWADDKRIIAPSRDIGIVYQHYSLYDFMNVHDNVSVGLKWDQTSPFYRLFAYFAWRKLRNKHLSLAKEMLKKLNLESSINSFPSELSGGMRQRVAIGQALIMQPRILLLDEPFGALDEATREELQDMLVDLYNENKVAKEQGKVPPYTILIVTHELNEAIYLSDRIIGLSQYHSDGKNGATIVYDRPATAFDKRSERDYGLFVHQRDEMRSVIFNESSTLDSKNSTFVERHV